MHAKLLLCDDKTHASNYCTSCGKIRMACYAFDSFFSWMGAKLLHTLRRNADELRDEINRSR